MTLIMSNAIARFNSISVIQYAIEHCCKDRIFFHAEGAEEQSALRNIIVDLHRLAGWRICLFFWFFFSSGWTVYHFWKAFLILHYVLRICFWCFCLCFFGFGKILMLVYCLNGSWGGGLSSFGNLIKFRVGCIFLVAGKRNVMIK